MYMQCIYIYIYVCVCVYIYLTWPPLGWGHWLNKLQMMKISRGTRRNSGEILITSGQVKRGWGKVDKYLLGKKKGGRFLYTTLLFYKIQKWKSIKRREEKLSLHPCSQFYAPHSISKHCNYFWRIFEAFQLLLLFKIACGIYQLFSGICSSLLP